MNEAHYYLIAFPLGHPNVVHLVGAVQESGREDARVAEGGREYAREPEISRR